jgi:hypothetical protein
VASPFQVPLILHVLGDVVARHPAFWVRLGRYESRVLGEELKGVSLRWPIYICGLARSGSTLLHEVVADHPAVATHRSKDYPLLFTPYWWRQATTHLPESTARERPHADGVMVTTESPDALEEMLWQAFFPGSHRPAASAVLGAEARHPSFESFYDAHIRKLLLVEDANWYAAKNNYHVARVAYLVRLYPKARILIPVRAPADHLASLIRQQKLFTAGQRANPRALAYMRRSGHYEFGLDRRPMHLGDDLRSREIRAALATGAEVKGLALYWDMVYSYLWRLLETDTLVRRACTVVRYEDVGADPGATLQRALRHCELPDGDSVAARHAVRVRAPTSDPTLFSNQERELIRDITRETAKLFGYIEES